MNNTIYNALYRTIEDRLNIADGEKPSRVLLYNAIGENGKYSIATYVQATIARDKSDGGTESQNVSFRLHVKNEEPVTITDDQHPEKYFIEITDIAPATGRGIKENEIPDNIDEFDIDGALKAITGALVNTPIEIYLKSNDDGSVSYWMHVRDEGARDVENSKESSYFIKCVVRHEIFFGGFLGHLSIIDTPDDDTPGLYSESTENLLATINGDVSNIMRSLQIDTLLNDSLIIDNLNTNIAVASKFAANNATISEATFKESTSISGTANFGDGCEINFGVPSDPDSVTNVTIASGSSVTFADDVNIKNAGTVNISNIDADSDINITTASGKTANVNVTTLTTSRLEVTQSESSTWNDISLLNPNKMVVGRYTGTDKYIRWDKLSNDGDVAVGGLYFNGQFDTTKEESSDTVKGFTHKKITSVIDGSDLKVDRDAFVSNGLFDTDGAIITAKTLKTLLENTIVDDTSKKGARYAGQIVYLVRESETT